ncbi:MAG: hypothetical protein ACFFB2_20460 [Promethearchaeota archaeon]
MSLSKRQRAELDAFQHIFVKLEKLENLEKKVEELEKRIEKLEEEKEERQQ